MTRVAERADGIVIALGQRRSASGAGNDSVAFRIHPDGRVDEFLGRGWLLELAWLAPDRTVAALVKSDFLLLLDAGSGSITPLSSAAEPRAPTSLVFSPDARAIAVASFRTLTLWDLHSRQALARVAPGDPLCRPVFSPDGRRIAVGTRDRVFVFRR